MDIRLSEVGLGKTVVIKYFENDDILAESGRGLQIINCYSDSVEFKGNSIIMKKYLA